MDHTWVGAKRALGCYALHLGRCQQVLWDEMGHIRVGSGKGSEIGLGHTWIGASEGYGMGVDKPGIGVGHK